SAALGLAVVLVSSSSAAASTSKQVIFESFQAIAFGASPAEGALYDASSSATFGGFVPFQPFTRLTATFQTAAPYDHAYAYYFMHDPTALAAHRMSLGSGQASTCYTTMDWSHTISNGFEPTTDPVWSGHPQPLVSEFSLADW